MLVNSWRARCAVVLLCGAASDVTAQRDDGRALRDLIRQGNGGVVRLDRNRVYHIREKLELKSLCPDGVAIDGNGATIRALPEFRHGALLTSTELLRDKPYDPGVQIRYLTLDGNGQVGRCLFGNWKNARIHELRVEGGTIYQVNALWLESSLSNIRVIGNAKQTNNGFDCNLTNSSIWNVSVDMRGNLKESGLWLNGCNNATIVNLFLTDGRTAFGLEDCKDVNLLNMRIRGKFSFRVVNILPAEPSERIYLYDLDLEAEHVGDDPGAGVHFNATKGGMVVRARISGPEPGVMLSNKAQDIDLIDLVLPPKNVHPPDDWMRLGRRRVWISQRRQRPGKRVNKMPVVYAGPNRTVKGTQEVALAAAVADETALKELKIAWSKVNGPGRAVFRPPGSPQSRVSFSKPGKYTVRLTAHDGEFEVHDEAEIRVLAARPGD